MSIETSEDNKREWAEGDNPCHYLFGYIVAVYMSGMKNGYALETAEKLFKQYPQEIVSMATFMHQQIDPEFKNPPPWLILLMIPD